MANLANPKSIDEILGMGAGISRRDFVGGTLLATGASLLDGLTPLQLLAAASNDPSDEWTGYGGVGENRAANGNTLRLLLAGHKMRDRAYDPLPADTLDTGEMYDCVVVGGGISGL